VTHRSPPPTADRLPPRRRAPGHPVRPIEESLTRLTQLATEVLEAPIALLSLQDSDGDHFLAQTGLSPSLELFETERLVEALSCSDAVLETSTAEATASAEEGERILEAIGVRACTAATAESAEKDVHGRLVVADRKPRDWPDSQKKILHEIVVIAADQVERQLAADESAAGALDIQDRTDRVLAQAPLFRALAEQSLVGIVVVGEDGFEYVNPTMARMFGYSPAEMVGTLPVQEIVAEEDRALVAENLRKRLQGEVQSIRYRFKGRRRDGTRIAVEVHGSRSDLDGKPVVIGTVLDITAQAEAETALRAAEERYRLVVRATKSAVLDWNIATGDLTWDADAAQLLRYPAKGLGRSVEWWYERIHADDRSEVISDLHVHLYGSADSCSFVYRFQRGDGGHLTIHHSCWVLRNEAGDPQRVVGMMTDVTHKAHAEEAHRFLAKASFVLDGSLEESVILPRIARLPVPWLADYCLVDLLDRSALRRVAAAHVDAGMEPTLLRRQSHPLDADPERHPVVGVVRNQQSVLVSDVTPAVLRRISHDADHLKALQKMGLRSYMIVPLRAHGETLGAITLAATDPTRRYTPADLVVAEDFAQRAAMAIAHGKLYREAREASRAREEVLGVVSHDLRNPLNTIQLCTDLLLDLADDRRSTNVQTLEIIGRAARQMNLMINDLLDITSLETGHFSIERASQEISFLLDEALTVLRPIAEQKGITLKGEVAPNVPPVELDSKQILRVLSNVVGNAIKFSFENGTVVIRVQSEEEKVRFVISDSGPGIEADELPHVFDRYWQARQGDRRGVGLGLAIAKGIVEAHGGSIEAKSEVGSGATFTFTLPQRDPAAS
jgi:PAS domain S-box-containing protein